MNQQNKIFETKISGAWGATSKLTLKFFALEKIQYEMKSNPNWWREKNHFLFSSQLFPETVLMQIFCWTLLNVKRKLLEIGSSYIVTCFCRLTSASAF